MTEMVPARAAGLAAMQAFIPAMGRPYENGRNFDHGLGQHKAVSMLSSYIRRRLITEAEVVTAALDAHGAEDARKFVEEVIWRGYYKGWLERRPQVWENYVQGLNADLMSLKRDRRLRRDIELVETGQTGWSISIHGRKNWLRRNTCTTMRVCGLRRFGFSRLDFVGD